MRFSIVHILLAFASILFSSVAATGDALGLGLTDTAEAALKAEFGDDTWNRITLKSCNMWSCLSIIPAIPCMIACGPNPFCIVKCASGVDICGCLGCLPEPIPSILKKAGICPNNFEILKAKKELGCATTDAEKEEMKAVGLA